MCIRNEQAAQAAAVKQEMKIGIFVAEEGNIQDGELVWTGLFLRAPNGQAPNVAGISKETNEHVEGFMARRSAQRYMKARVEADSIEHFRTRFVELDVDSIYENT